jgi:hypothetical protein
LLWLLGFAPDPAGDRALFFLRCRHFIVALFMTALVGVVLPFVLIELMAPLFHDKNQILLVVVLPLACFPVAVAISLLMKSRDYRDIMRRVSASVVFLVGFFVLAERLSSPSLLAEVFQAEGANALLLIPVLQCGLALLCGRLLHRNLVHRTFAFPT